MNASAAVSLRINDHPPVSGTFTVEQEYVAVHSLTATKPDKRWEHVDAAGHFHAYDQSGELPTLTTKRVEVESCGDEDCSYSVDACRICGERVNPGRVPDDMCRDIPGRISWKATTPERLEQRSLVTVRAEFTGYMVFGVGQVISTRIVSAGQCESLIVGAGPLGERKVGKS
jgi:hypothetical protein